MVLLLLKYKAEINAKDNLGRTPLMYAYLYNNLETAKLLLKYRADTTVIDNNGRNLNYYKNNAINYLK